MPNLLGLQELPPLPCPGCGATPPQLVRLDVGSATQIGGKWPRTYHDYTENQRCEARCAACRHTWIIERHYSDRDVAAGLTFSWSYPQAGRVFHEYRDEAGGLSTSSP
jgi:hypothetical protein